MTHEWVESLKSLLHVKITNSQTFSKTKLWSHYLDISNCFLIYVVKSICLDIQVAKENVIQI